MDAPSYPHTIIWGPGYIGLVVANFLYGVEICQFVFYLRTFRRDNSLTKLLVYVVSALDSTHFLCVVATYYRLLITCHNMLLPTCPYHFPRMLIVLPTVLLVYCVTAVVQVFYAHRVWIISGQNKIITLAVLVCTALQLAFGLMVSVNIFQTPNTPVLSSSRYGPAAAVASAVCDAIITVSVMYYLRPTGIRKNDIVKKLVLVFVQMGLFTFINVLAMAILYFIEDHALGQFLAAAPGVIVSKSYVNSMLAVLNARKPIRDQQEHVEASIELSTIHSSDSCPHGPSNEQTNIQEC